jgi:hypothetical protein
MKARRLNPTSSGNHRFKIAEYRAACCLRWARASFNMHDSDCFEPEQRISQYLRAFAITSSAVGGFGACQLRQSRERIFSGLFDPSVEK